MLRILKVCNIHCFIHTCTGATIRSKPACTLETTDCVGAVRCCGIAVVCPTVQGYSGTLIA